MNVDHWAAQSLMRLKENALGWGPVAEPAIVVDHLVKCFGDVEAVKGVSF